jgi:hypothetical protein
MPEGALVRIRRLTADAARPVRAVIEVDRRGSSPRGIDAHRHPPALMTVEAESEQGVVASLLPFVEEDAAVARLIAQRSGG